MTQSSSASWHSSRYKMIFDNAFDGIVYINEKGIIKEYNKAAEAIFGWMPHEVLGQNVSMLISGEHKNKHDGYIKKFLQSGRKRLIDQPRTFETKNKLGNPIWVEIRLASYKDGGGEYYFVAIIRDLSSEAMMKAMIEEHLRKERQRLDRFIKTSPYMFLLLNHDLEIIDYNDKAYKFLQQAYPGKMLDNRDAKLSKYHKSTILQNLADHSTIKELLLEFEKPDGAFIRARWSTIEHLASNYERDSIALLGYEE